MITSIFSKSKPVNFLVVFVVILITFFVAEVKFSNPEFTPAFFLKKGSMFLLAFVSVLLLNFVVNKNSLTKKNNYEILLFSLFLLLIPQSVLGWKIMASNFFILLSLRRIISLRSQKEVIKKLFDAAFWIGIASVFYFWAILFVLVIIAALIFFSENRLRYWIIPFVALVAVLLLAICYSLVRYDSLFWFSRLNYSIDFNYTSYNTLAYVIAITVLLSFGIWSSFFYLQNLKSKMKTLKPGFKIVLTTFLVAWALVIIAPQKNGNEFLFLFAPLAIIVTNYIETIKEKWFKEVFLATFIVIPAVLLML
ncbi:MAG TPA: DUF6427 family protein [Flavobacteriaceae bacterium]|nr:DUF6427 family protein [Flavobacteriaceae bacterium]